MKYELQTIPVWKAMEAQTECPLCHLEEESEGRGVVFFLGNSIMAPEMRVQVNRRGFCPHHFHLLLTGEGKLGYSLALATHLDELEARFAGAERRVERAHGRSAAKAVEGYAAELRRQESDCLLCDRIRANMLNFTYTIAKLFSDEEEFRGAYARSRGVCLHHLPGLLEMGVEVVPPVRIEEWHRTIFEVQRRALAQNRADLEAFTWQFDYQTEKRTPEHARDAVPRAVRRLAGYRAE